MTLALAGGNGVDRRAAPGQDERRERPSVPWGTGMRALRNANRVRGSVIAPMLYDVLETGAGEGIRTLDPNLGKVVLYP